MSAPEGPRVGSRCLAHLDGAWRPGAIERLHEDGTFQIGLDRKTSAVLPSWYGVTAGEIVWDDRARWPAVYAELTAGAAFELAHLQRAIEWVSSPVTAPAVEAFWRGAARGDRLDQDGAYELVLRAGLCATQIAERRPVERSAEAAVTFYWNQIRMGGRAPGEVARPVEVGDALAAAGLASAPLEDAPLGAFETAHGIPVPAALRAFARRRGALAAASELHPNNPSHVDVAHWVPERGVRAPGAAGDVALPLLEQDGYTWCAVFGEGDADAPVYLRWEDEDGVMHVRRAAPTLGWFFWDLIQCGLVWWEATRASGYRPAVRDDIGLRRAS